MTQKKERLEQRSGFVLFSMGLGAAIAVILWIVQY